MTTLQFYIRFRSITIIDKAVVQSNQHYASF